MVIHDYLHSDDDQLIGWSVKGDSKAFAEIVRRYENMVARTVKGMLGDSEHADDIGQDTFIRLYNSLGEFRGDSKLSTYIQRIAINLSLNEIKRKKRFISLFTRGSNNERGSEYEIPDSDGSREEQIDLKEVLMRSIDKLPPEFKSVVVLRLVQGYSTRETSEILKLPLGTVLSRLSRARDQLKKEIKKTV